MLHGCPDELLFLRKYIPIYSTIAYARTKSFGGVIWIHQGQIGDRPFVLEVGDEDLLERSVWHHVFVIRFRALDFCVLAIVECQPECMRKPKVFGVASVDYLYPEVTELFDGHATDLRDGFTARDFPFIVQAYKSLRMRDFQYD